MATENNEKSPSTNSEVPRCRVAIIGAQRPRVAKVVSLLRADESFSRVQVLPPGGDANPPRNVPPVVEIEYMPCVATFDSYEDEHGADVRYLVKVEYHGPEGKSAKGKSLAPFFDDGLGDEKSEGYFPGITAVAVGCGIEGAEDVERIESVLKTLSSSCVGANVSVEGIQPNPGYASMKDETEAFRALDDEAKKDAAAQHTIGPGKMAKFAYEFVRRAILLRFEKELAAHQKSEKVVAAVDEAPTLVELPDNNPNEVRYACKMCRTVLFGEADLEDPPHAKSQHDFSKKSANKRMVSLLAPCANAFLAQGLPWMGDMADMEGKLHCPKCKTKVGHWTLCGDQCSCGTWVAPAILVPLSKVDVIRPISENPLTAMFVQPKYVDDITAVGREMERALVLE